MLEAHPKCMRPPIIFLFFFYGFDEEWTISFLSEWNNIEHLKLSFEVNTIFVADDCDSPEWFEVDEKKKSNRNHLIQKKWKKENYSQTCICLTLKTWNLGLEKIKTIFIYLIYFGTLIVCPNPSRCLRAAPYFFFRFEKYFFASNTFHIFVSSYYYHNVCNVRCTIEYDPKPASECDAFNLYCESFFCDELMVSNCRWTDICL